MDNYMGQLWDMTIGLQWGRQRTKIGGMAARLAPQPRDIWTCTAAGGDRSIYIAK